MGEDVAISSDVLLEEALTGAALGLRVRMPSGIRSKAPGLFLWVGAVPPPGQDPAGGVKPPATIPLEGWKLCADSYCEGVLASGPLSPWKPGSWHRLELGVHGDLATGTADSKVLFQDQKINIHRLAGQGHKTACSSNWNCSLPASGWAAIASTLGGVQFDDFAVHGLAGKDPTSKKQAAASTCRGSGVEAGDILSSVPCSMSGAAVQWTLDANRVLHPVSDTSLCITVNASGSAQEERLMIAPCQSASPVFAHDKPTGRLVGAAGHCASVQPRQEASRARVTAASCEGAPCDFQQFQFNPQTGMLRHKGGQCVHQYQTWGWSNDYRDCCLAVCSEDSLFALVV